MNVEICKDLTFDDGLHVYKLHGVTLPSVTQLMKPLTDNYYGDTDYEFLKNAATRGTTIHNSIENYWLFNVVDIPHEYKAYMDAFLKFVEMYKPKPLATEVRFYHKYLYYAGTADLIYTVDFAYAENIDGKLVKRYQVNAGKITRIYCGKSKSTYYLTSCRNGRQERELYRNRFDAEDKKKELEKI